MVEEKLLEMLVWASLISIFVIMGTGLYFMARAHKKHKDETPTKKG